jgi:hypothetical protein
MNKEPYTHIHISKEDIRILPLATLGLEKIINIQYPMILYNCQKIEIGKVENPDQLIKLWNSDPANQEYGKLDKNPSKNNSFRLIMNPELVWMSTLKEVGKKYYDCVFVKETNRIT